MLVSALYLIAGPGLAVATAGGLAAAASLLFTSVPASRHWRPPPFKRSWRPRSLRTPGMRTVVAGTFALGVTVGLVNLAVPAAALRYGSATLSGVYFALVAVGEAVGGGLYGARHWPIRPRLRLALLAGVQAVILASAFAFSLPRLLGLQMVLYGTVGAPISITYSLLLDDVAQDALAEAYTLMVAIGVAGSAMGYAIAGALVSDLGAPGVFGVAAVLSATSCVYVLTRRRSLAVETE